MGTAVGTTLTGIDVRDRSTKEGGEGKVFVVEYEGEMDFQDPHNWSFATRLGATINIASIGWVVGFASSVDSGAPQAAADFGVSDVTESLATGLFLIGFGVGALFAGPVSETIGRNPVYITTLSLYMIFIMAAALAPNIGAQLAFRFIAGCFAATPLTCAGGSISDLWSPMERVYAFPVFANAAFMAPIFGPIIGGFVGESSLVSWRWTEWITLIISGLILFNVAMFQPTIAPHIQRADHHPHCSLPDSHLHHPFYLLERLHLHLHGDLWLLRTNNWPILHRHWNRTLLRVSPRTSRIHVGEEGSCQDQSGRW